MNTIEEIFTRFNNLKHPPMNAPHDLYLTELRQSFELDIDSIAGLLSFEINNKKTPHLKELLNVPDKLEEALKKIDAYSSVSDDGAKYKEELRKYIIDVIDLVKELNLYM